jgi:hypothetical protein
MAASDLTTDRLPTFRQPPYRGEPGPAAAWNLAIDAVRGLDRVCSEWDCPKAKEVREHIRTAQPVFVSFDVAAEIMAAANALPNEISIPSEWVDRPLVIHIEGGIASIQLGNPLALAPLLGFCVWPGQSRPEMMAVYEARRPTKLAPDPPLASPPDTIDGGDVWFGLITSIEPGWINAEGLNEELHDDYLRDNDAKPLSAPMWWLYACLAWMRDKIPVIDNKPIDRQARRRLVRSGATESDLVGGFRVITLRTAERDRADASEAEARIYSHRWIVKGHWRTIGEAGSQRRTWVRMHMKGPAGAPMLAPRKEIWQVVR